MKIMEFPAKFINWVRQCASTAMFSIVINGERVGYFLGKRGLRQGDHLSTYMFLLVMEGFSSQTVIVSELISFGFSFCFESGP